MTLNRKLFWLVPVGVLLVWEIASRTGIIPTLFFPPPSSILAAFVNLIASGRLAVHLGTTLLRLGLGLVIGAIPGIAIGLAMGWSPDLYALLDPFVSALHPIPKIAIFPLIMIIFGLGDGSKIVIIAITVFFPVLINSMVGVHQLNPVFFEVTKNYGASRWLTFKRLVFPGSLPMILAGVRIALNMALMVTVMVELLNANQGLGVLLWFDWETLRVPELYAVLVVIALVGLVINTLLPKWLSRLAAWYEFHPGEQATS
jgi:NitT/TauT family transport system permease protein